MSNPELSDVLRKADEPAPPIETTRFAQPKYRGTTLESIQQDIRKTIEQLDAHARKLDEYRQGLKATVDELMKAAG